MPAEYPDQKELARRKATDPSFESARQNETSGAEPGRSGSRIVQNARKTTATVVRLAQRLKADPDELAAKYDDDTLRRTRFPVVEEVQEDGTRLFKDPPQVIDGIRSLVQR